MVYKQIFWNDNNRKEWQDYIVIIYIILKYLGLDFNYSIGCIVSTLEGKIHTHTSNSNKVSSSHNIVDILSIRCSL